MQAAKTSPPEKEVCTDASPGIQYPSPHMGLMAAEDEDVPWKFLVGSARLQWEMETYALGGRLGW